MAFQLSPTNNLVDLLVFLNESRISFVPPPHEILAEGIAREIGNPLLTQSLLDSLGLLDVIPYIPVTADTFEFIQLAKTMKTMPPGNLRRVCNKTFKGFCGSENLTSDGRISRDAAVELIHAYASNGRLRGDGPYTYFNSILQEALNTTANSVSDSKLVELVEAVFA